MCWSNNIAIPLVLKKPLKVYKVGTSATFYKGGFISLYQNFMYIKSKVMPTVKINPRFVRFFPLLPYTVNFWNYDRFYIHEGYHSYLTEKKAIHSKDKDDDDVGIFEIPAGATIYVNYKRREVVSTDIKYLGPL